MWPKLLKFVSAKYNLGFITFIYPFDAKIMLLTRKNVFFHIRHTFGMRQNLADVSFSQLHALKFYLYISTKVLSNTFNNPYVIRKQHI